MAQIILYRGMVADAADPLMQGRLRVGIPAVGSTLSWAKVHAERPASPWPPKVGGVVAVAFESNSLQAPVAMAMTAADNILGMRLLRAEVIDTADPMLKGRLRIAIPALMTSDVGWATSCLYLSAGSARVVRVGAMVGVLFENGNKDYPVVIGTLT